MRRWCQWQTAGENDDGKLGGTRIHTVSSVSALRSCPCPSAGAGGSGAGGDGSVQDAKPKKRNVAARWVWVELQGSAKKVE